MSNQKQEPAPPQGLDPFEDFGLLQEIAVDRDLGLTEFGLLSLRQPFEANSQLRAEIVTVLIERSGLRRSQIVECRRILKTFEVCDDDSRYPADEKEQAALQENLRAALLDDVRLAAECDRLLLKYRSSDNAPSANGKSVVNGEQQSQLIVQLLIQKEFNPLSWQRMMTLIADDHRLQTEMEIKAAMYVRHERRIDLLATVNQKLFQVVIQNADIWYAKCVSGDPSSPKPNKGRPQRKKIFRADATRPALRRNWRGYLLNQYPKIMQRAVEKLRSPSGPIPPDLQATGLSTPDSAAQRERTEQVHNAMLRLTPEEREVVYLKFYNDWSDDQIALQAGIPKYRVAKILKLAIEALGQYIPNDEI